MSKRDIGTVYSKDGIKEDSAPKRAKLDTTESKDEKKAGSSQPAKKKKSAASSSNSSTFFKAAKEVNADADVAQAMDWDFNEDDFFAKPLGMLSWDVDGVLIKFAESQKTQTEAKTGTYVFVNRERILKIAKRANDNGIINICLTARSSDENANFWLSVPKILQQYEKVKGELFSRVRYSNKALKSKTLIKIADIEGVELEKLAHIDDSAKQREDCANAGILTFAITSGTDEEFDAIDKHLDDLIARKKKTLPKKNKDAPEQKLAS